MPFVLPCCDFIFTFLLFVVVCMLVCETSAFFSTYFVKFFIFFPFDHQLVIRCVNNLRIHFDVAVAKLAAVAAIALTVAH